MAMQKPIHVAVGLLKQDNQFLIAKRPMNKPYSGYWEFPGGKVELGESSEAALYRELQEELGIEIKQANLWFSHQHTYPDKTVLLDLWLVKVYSGTPSALEHAEIRWADVESINNLDILAGNKPILQQLNKL